MIREGVASASAPAPPTSPLPPIVLRGDGNDLGLARCGLGELAETVAVGLIRGGIAVASAPAPPTSPPSAVAPHVEGRGGFDGVPDPALSLKLARRVWVGAEPCFERGVPL